MWLSFEGEQADLKKEISNLPNQSGLAVDENMKLNASSTDDCLVLQLPKYRMTNSNPALLTSRNCKQKAKFWCSVDVTEIKTLDSGESPDLACLLSNETSSTNANQGGRRRKRETENGNAMWTKYNLAGIIVQ